MKAPTFLLFVVSFAHAQSRAPQTPKAAATDSRPKPPPSIVLAFPYGTVWKAV